MRTRVFVLLLVFECVYLLSKNNQEELKKLEVARIFNGNNYKT